MREKLEVLPLEEVEELEPDEPVLLVPVAAVVEGLDRLVWVPKENFVNEDVGVADESGDGEGWGTALAVEDATTVLTPEEEVPTD